jgi:uncharacterized protein (DUF952 family)
MTDAFVYHIADAADWAAAREAGEYRPPSLDAQGFVHCSTREQVIETANRYYRGRDGLVLLCIEPALLRAELRYEPPDMPDAEQRDGLFPHLYGPLNLDAVTRALPFVPGPDGAFRFPAALAEEP